MPPAVALGGRPIANPGPHPAASRRTARRTPLGGCHEPLRVRACLRLARVFSRRYVHLRSSPSRSADDAGTGRQGDFVTPAQGRGSRPGPPGTSKFDREAKEVVTTYKLKNMSSAPIAMLKIEEYWYDKSGKLVSTDTKRYMQPFQPGEVIEMTTRAPQTESARLEQATSAVARQRQGHREGGQGVRRSAARSDARHSRRRWAASIAGA